MSIPSSVGRICDRIAATVLYMPDMRLPHSDLGFDEAYLQLEESLGLIKEEIGDQLHGELLSLSRMSKQ